MSFDIKPHKDNIEKAIKEGGKIWENKCLDEFKSCLKSHCRDILGEQCCYCRKNTHGEFNMVLDIEHVLPKKHFARYMFSVFNLSVSCKRCNMNVKNEDISFIIDIDAIIKKPQNKELYKFIHPNLDDYFAHIQYLTQTVNQKKIIKYNVINGSSKGDFTYKYFKLFELEVDSINSAQGVEQKHDLSENINVDIAKSIEDLLAK